MVVMMAPRLMLGVLRTVKQFHENSSIQKIWQKNFLPCFQTSCYVFFRSDVLNSSLMCSDLKPTNEVSPTTKFVSSNLPHAPSAEQTVLGLPSNDSFSAEKLFSKTVSSMHRRKFRERCNKMLLDGTDLIKLAMQHGVEIETIFYSQDNALPVLESYDMHSLNVVKVPNKYLIALTKSSETERPKVVALCKKPNVEPNSDFILGSNAVVLCSNIRDPQNMGLIISAAAASGCDTLLFTKGCVDVWERKVLTYANGAHFYMNIRNNLSWENIPKHLPQNPFFYIADNSVDVDDWLHETAHECYESNRTTNEESAVVNVNSDMPSRMYCDLEFSGKSPVICVGGETEGIDPKIGALAKTFGGVKVKIPLENGMESLNVSVALSILLYQARRKNVFRKSCNTAE